MAALESEASDQAGITKKPQLNLELVKIYDDLRHSSHSMILCRTPTAKSRMIYERLICTELTVLVRAVASFCAW